MHNIQNFSFPPPIQTGRFDFFSRIRPWRLRLRLTWGYTIHGYWETIRLDMQNLSPLAPIRQAYPHMSSIEVFQNKKRSLRGIRRCYGFKRLKGHKLLEGLKGCEQMHGFLLNRIWPYYWGPSSSTLTHEILSLLLMSIPHGYA